MFLARRLGEIWWIPGAAVFVVIGACFAFVQPYLVTDTTPLRDPGLGAPADEFEREQGVSGDPGLGRGRQRHDEPGERLRRRLRPLAQGRALEHDDRRQLLGRRGAGRARPRDRPPLEQAHPEGARLVRALRAARRLGADAGDAAPRRDGRGGSGAARAPRRRRAAARARAGAGAGSAAGWRPRPTGRRCRRRATRRRPAGSSSASRRRPSRTPIRPPGRTSSSTATRRWRSASRWPRRWSSAAAGRLRQRAYVSVYSGPEPPSGGVSRPPRAVIAPHWTQFDGVSFTSTVPSPSVVADLVDLRRAHPGPHLGHVARNVALDPDVVRLVVARAVAGGEHRRELVEGQRAVGRRVARRAVRAQERRRRVGLVVELLRREAGPSRRSSRSRAPPPTKNPFSNAWRMFRTSRRLLPR